MTWLTVVWLGFMGVIGTNVAIRQSETGKIDAAAVTMIFSALSMVCAYAMWDRYL